MLRTSALMLLLVLLAPAPAQAQETGGERGALILGFIVSAGGRYDDVRMCVASPAGAKGGIALDIAFFAEFGVCFTHTAQFASGEICIWSATSRPIMSSTVQGVPSPWRAAFPPCAMPTAQP